jgi:acyl-CoA synthetase (AMP-forming)/AMP-acid ligase II
MDVRVVDAENREVKTGDVGALVIKLPLPPGTFPTLWNADERFIDSYLAEFPGYYKTADAGYVDEDGYVYVMSRTDDIINVAGHRLSTGGMEEVLAAHPDVAECAVIGVSDELKGQLPLGFLVLKAGVDRDHTDITQETVKMVRQQIGPVAAFKTATVVNRLLSSMRSRSHYRVLATPRTPRLGIVSAHTDEVEVEKHEPDIERRRTPARGHRGRATTTSSGHDQCLLCTVGRARGVSCTLSLGRRCRQRIIRITRFGYNHLERCSG